MMKLILAGVAALAVSAGAAFAATTPPPPAADYGRRPMQATQLNQHYDYVAQQQSALGYTTQNNGTPVVSHPFSDWIGP